MTRIFRRTDADKEKHKKLLSRWSGPWTVVSNKLEHNNCYSVEMKNETVTVNIKNMKPYHSRPKWMDTDIEVDDPLFVEEREHLPDPTDGMTVDEEILPTISENPEGQTQDKKGQNENPATIEKSVTHVDVEITLNQIKSWWCAEELDRGLDKNGKGRVQVKPLAKNFKPRCVQKTR